MKERRRVQGKFLFLLFDVVTPSQNSHARRGGFEQGNNLLICVCVGDGGDLSLLQAFQLPVVWKNEIFPCYVVYGNLKK